MKTRDYYGESKAVDMAARTITHYISTPTLDHDGTILIPAGLDDSRFRKSPTVFRNHDAKVENALGVNVSLDVSDDGVLAVTRINDRPPSLPEGVEWFPDTFLFLHSCRALRQWSVGFDGTAERKPSEAERKAYGAGLKGVFERWLLVEYSGVGIASNEDCNTLSRRGYSDELIRWIERGRPLALDILKREFGRPKTIVVLPPLKRHIRSIVQDTVQRLIDSDRHKIVYDSAK